MEEKELFEDYEMRSWEFTPRVYKILGVATIANFLLLFAFGQFNLLTTRGCDTPYAGIVCQVLDSAYVASTFLGKDNEWQSRPYAKDEIADADITYIDVSDKLEYPEGYFALANPEPPMTENLVPTDELAGMPTTNSPGSFAPLPGSPDRGLITNPAVTPTPNKSLENQEDVKSPWEIAGNNPKPTYPRITPRKTPRPTKNPVLSNDSPGRLPDSDNVAGTPKKTPQPTPEPTPTEGETNKAKDEFSKGFNKKPLQDFADGVIAKVDSEKPEEKVDLKQSFIVTLDGTLTKEGTFDAKKTRFVKGEGNQQMVDVAKSAIEAMGSSTIFSYLQALGVDKVNITLVQDDKQISAIIKSNQPTEEKARTISSGFNGLIAIANINTKDDKEVQALLKATKFTAEGKSFTINFAMPKADAHQLIDKKLQEARQKKSQPSNGEGAKESATAKTK